MSVALLAALIVGGLAINLVIAWLLIRGDHDVHGVLTGTSLDAPDQSTTEVESDDGGGHRSDRGGREPSHPSGPDGEPPPLSADCDPVVCRHCGAENRPGYRYCRWCVRSGIGEEGRSPAAEPSSTQRSF
ncbi:hypothetical protein JCM18237_24410 [Halorubrum luteum]